MRTSDLRDRAEHASEYRTTATNLELFRQDLVTLIDKHALAECAPDIRKFADSARASIGAAIEFLEEGDTNLAKQCLREADRELALGIAEADHAR